MKRTSLAAILALMSCLSGCSPKISQTLNGPALTALAPDAPVLVVGDLEPAPVGCAVLGTLRVGDSGVTINCGFDRMVAEAKSQARKLGGNILKITEIIEPNMSSTCYRISAEVMFTPDLKAVEATQQRLREQADKSRLPAGTPYALLYAYRPAGFGASAVSYDLHLDDSVVYHVRYDSRTVIRLKPGAVTLWTKANAPRLTLQVEPGKEYFLRCGFAPGAFTPQPWTTFVGTQLGRHEYEQVIGQP